MDMSGQMWRHMWMHMGAYVNGSDKIMRPDARYVDRCRCHTYAAFSGCARLQHWPDIGTDVDTCCHQMQLFAVCRERWGAYTGTAFLRAPPWQAWPDTRLTLSGVSQDGSRRGKTRSARVRLGFEMLTFKYVRSRSSFGSRKRPLATYLVIRYL